VMCAMQAGQQIVLAMVSTRETIIGASVLFQADLARKSLHSELL
jgi:hypothetical protein